jgi:hypothetical protein
LERIIEPIPPDDAKVWLANWFPWVRGRVAPLFMSKSIGRTRLHWSCRSAADLDAQLKGRSRLDKLSAQQQAAIIHLMNVHTIDVVLDLLAAPSPTGMSFKIGRSALYEFKRRYEKREAQRQREQRTKAFDDLLKKSDDSQQTFLVNFEHLLHVKGLNLASLPETSNETLDALTTTINKLRKQTLAERKQTHAELNSI